MNLIQRISLMLVAFLSPLALYSGTVETSAKASKPTAQWKFEVKNKDSKSLYIQVQEVGGNSLLTASNAQVKGAIGSKESQAGYLRIADLEAGKEYKILIWNNRDDQAYRASINADKAYEIRANPSRKMILLTYEDGKLRPQKGNRFKGAFTGYSSSSGLPVFANVKESEIKTVESRKGVKVQ